MAAIILPRKHYTQPQGRVKLDQSNPLAQGLVALYGRNGFDYVREAPAISSTAQESATRHGIAQGFAGGASRTKCPPIQVSVENFSSSTILVPNFGSTSNDVHFVWYVQEAEGVVADRLRMIWLNNSSGFFIDTNGGFAYTSKPTFNAGDLVVIGYSRSGQFISKNQYYINGSPSTTVMVTDGGSYGVPTNPTTMWLGGDIELSSRGLNGAMLLHAHWNRPTSADEHREFWTNPNQLFRADPIRIYSLPPVLTIPSLSNPGVIDITATSARPQVTLAY